MGVPMYQTLLFDLDGTLTDSGPGIIHSAAYALEKMGIADDNSSHLSRFIGPPLYESFAQFYGLNAAETQQAVDYFREYFTSKGMFENHPYPGIPELLGKLQEQGKTLLIATSKPEIFAKQILAHFELDRYFTIIAGASLDDTRIKKGQIIAYALDQLEKINGKAVMIGDRKHDVIGAKQHQLDSIGVLYGYGDREELTTAGASHIVQTVEELEDLLG